jgi:N-acetylmuramoyl-L-alanine amidase
MSIKQLFGFLIIVLFIALIIEIYNNRPINTTVVIQAGHDGRIFGNTGSVNGKYKEVEWNLLVAKEVEKELKKNGIDVVRVGAKIPIANARIAVAIHFDGSNKPCSTGASIGYDKYHSQARRTALRWKKIYKNYFRFRWHKDNFTKNLADYYGFNRVNTEKGFLVLELGEITCDKQVEWLEPRLELISDKIADFIMDELDR